MIRIQGEARRQQKQKQRKMWSGAIAAVVLLCCIPFAKIQLDRLPIGSMSSDQVNPMVAIEDTTIESAQSVPQDNIVLPEAQNAAVPNDSASEEPAANDNGLMKENLFVDENLSDDENSIVSAANHKGIHPGDESASGVQAPSVDIPLVASLEGLEEEPSLSVIPYLRSADGEAKQEEEPAITAEQIDRYREQLSQANADLKTLNEQLAQYEKQLTEAPTDEMKTKKEETNQQIKDLEQQIKTMEDSMNKLEEKLNAIKE